MTGFIIGFVGAMVGTVSGYILKHFQDGRLINELISDVLDLAKKCDEKDAEIRKLREEVNRYNALKALKEIRLGKVESVVPDVEFWNVNDLPKPFNEDIDFGGKF